MNNPLISFGVHALTLLFAIGMVGSSVVVAISFVEDLAELFGKE